MACAVWCPDAIGLDGNTLDGLDMVRLLCPTEKDPRLEPLAFLLDVLHRGAQVLYSAGGQGTCTWLRWASRRSLGWVLGT